MYQFFLDCTILSCKKILRKIFSLSLYFADLFKKSEYEQGCAPPVHGGCEVSSVKVECYCTKKNCNTKKMIDKWIKQNIAN